MTLTHPNRVAIGAFMADLDGTPGRDERITAKMTGWDAPPIRLDVESKAQQDGGWDAAGFYGPRKITLQGLVIQPSAAAAQLVADELTSLSPRESHTFTVENDWIGPRWCMVRVEGGAVIEWVTPWRFTYTIQLVAPDPLKYGPETFASTSLAGAAGGAGLLYPLTYPLDYGVPPGVTPGAITLGNAGTAAYWPRLRIDGPVPNPSVTMVETGDSLRYNGTLAAGQWLDIDTANRRVLLNGQVSMRHLASVTGRWLAVPNGGGSLTWTADAADPRATLSAWGYESVWY